MLGDPSVRRAVRGGSRDSASPGVAASTGLVPRQVVEFDREDIFGVRRACAWLPEREWDSFLARWTEVGENCHFDIDAIRGAAEYEAQRWCGIDEGVAGAWFTISAAMTAYLAWRVE